jgi:hypothetical protein
MFKDPRGQNERPETNPPQKIRAIGCRSWGTVVWILIGLAMLLWMWNPFDTGLNETTEISYSAFRQK